MERVNSGAPDRVRVATYNIHRCRGMDGQTRPERIAEVLTSINADVIALQEVIGAGHGHGGQAEAIGAALGMGWVMATTRLHRGYLFGNVVLSRFPITHHTQYDLSWRQCESRCAQRADVQIGGRCLHLFNVHLGTALLERRYQAKRLQSYLQHQKLAGPRVVLGDFNEWLTGPTKLLGETMESVDLGKFLRRRRTYPGMLPLLHLDHVYHAGPVEVVGVELPRTRKTLVASDHLPLVAELELT